jgi:hypothetical protein
MLDNALHIFPLTQVILHIKLFLHPRTWPLFSKRGHMVIRLGLRHEAVTAEMVMILFLVGCLCLIGQLMNIAETSRIWLQSLAPHGPYKNSHSNKSFGGNLMKVYLKRLQDFDQHLVERKAKPSFHEAPEDYHFIPFWQRNGVFSFSPHYSNIMKIFAFHYFNLTLPNRGFSKNNMAWSPRPIFSIFILTLDIEAFIVASITR